MRKWPGVKAAISEGLLLNADSGLEFRQASIVDASVENSSKVRVATPRTRFRWCLKHFTSTSHRPPKCGALGGVRLQ